MNPQALLSIEQLSASVEGKPLLQGIDLSIQPGEVHFLLGPNGSGKSTLAYLLAGKPHYEVTQGKVRWQGVDLLEIAPEERAHQGLLMAFQHPVAIPGVTNFQFLYTAINEKRKATNLAPLTMPACLALVKETLQKIDLDLSFLHRPVNEGFSGGEKKKNELLQLMLLQPKLLILDETDSGLDLATRQWMGRQVLEMQRQGVACIVITHYLDLLEAIRPSKVHWLQKGRLVRSGGAKLAAEVLAEGYDLGGT